MDKKFKDWCQQKIGEGAFAPPVGQSEMIGYLEEAFNLGKSTKTKKKDVDECYPEFARIWMESYPIIGIDTVGGGKLKSLIRKTKAHCVGKGKEPAKDLVCNTFQYVVNYVKRERHFVDGKPLATWDSQYLSIFHEISNGKQTTRNPTTRDIINSL